ncbi:MAG: hypothetical protein KatS3mg002_0873 [Candidatus Woesearchaeota archaeon]|nr:MAG: hypothetical protein KatS3mg002_0873 [Candidatus Woesearchaeota archaeon]
MPSVYELFYNYARSDSKLIAIGPLREAVLSHYPELKIMGNSIYK